jgi:hypothetical protein
MARVDRSKAPLRARIAAALRTKNQAELSVLRPIIWALALHWVKAEEIYALTLDQALEVVEELDPDQRQALLDPGGDAPPFRGLRGA